MLSQKNLLWKRLAAAIILFCAVPLFSTNFFTEKISKEKLRLMPIPSDFRNYFFFQSIDSVSTIIIGDFTGSDKMLVQITDTDCNNTIDVVDEYLKDANRYRRKKTSSSVFFKDDIAELKRDIISGQIFKKNYSYHMKSLDFLKSKLKDGTDIYKSGYGYNVKFFDPDATTTVMSEFYFEKKDGKYSLIFKTHYYKVFKMKIVPAIPYSVYCKETKDPVVAETVEALYKLLP